MGAEESRQAEEELKKERENRQKDQAKIKRLEKQLAQAKAEQQEDPGTRTGRAAIAQCDRSLWKVIGNVFTFTGEDSATLLSFRYAAVVARLTLTIRNTQDSVLDIGIISSSLVKKAFADNFLQLKGGAGWNLSAMFLYAQQNFKDTNRGSACEEGREGQRIVLEADGREGKRTLKLSQDGKTAPVFFTNIPVPFRFAMCLWTQKLAMEIESVEVLEEAQMVGGTIAVAMDE
ncbi:hypothetical protein BLNAU_8538 [Blattamonas nauphoetae]|uniref:Uncharacterized protein n=1 Tax=Blattamonas nauphoetae TaxID=2049346 RepID=A0ABQ9XYE1_9EUKA|nr:hypothetical protein BLNAU_8538 [Blattamonas nauphoetae]